MNWIIVIISLLLAGAAGYFFLIWWSSSPQDKIAALTKKHEKTKDEHKKFLDDLKSKTLAEVKTELDTDLKANDINADRKKVGEEIQAILKEVKTKEDLTKTVYTHWDYGYAGGVGLAVFIVSYFLIKMIIGSTVKGDNA